VRAAAARFGPALAVMVALFALSSVPGSNAPSAVPDKLAHLAVYAVLGYAMQRAFHGNARPPRTAIVALAALAAVLYGITDEYHQTFVEGRTASLADLGFDALGAVLGALAYAVRHRRTVKR